jgi:hypothetical protein
MGAQTAQVQSPQSSQPASKGAGQSASSEPGSGKGGQMSAMSGQPRMGQPNTNGNTALKPVDAGFLNTPINNFETSSGVINNPNPSYSNTIGNISGQPTPLPSPNMPQPNMGGIAGGVENNYRGIAGLVNPVARMPGIDSYGGQPQVGGPAQMGGSYFGDNMLSNMGNNTRLGNNSQLGQLGNMDNRFGQLGNMANIPQIEGLAGLETGMPGGEGGKTTFSQPRGKGGGGGQGGGKGSS